MFSAREEEIASLFISLVFFGKCCYRPDFCANPGDPGLGVVLYQAKTPSNRSPILAHDSSRKTPKTPP